MNSNDALSGVRTRNPQTPQSEQADPRQAANNAGGYSFTIPAEARVHRFLTLGTDGGTYYSTEQALTKDNAQVVLDAARSNGAELVDQIIEISTAGRAPRQNPGLFALAAASGLANDPGRWAALDALREVARTGSTLLTFIKYAEQFRGWGRGLQRAVAQWYLSQEPERLAYQVLKYKQRDGWSHRDVLRLAKLGRKDLHGDIGGPMGELLHWITGKPADLDALPLVAAADRAHKTTKVKDWVQLIEGNSSLSHEMLPSEALREAAVWEALFWKNLPLGALIRNLGRMTSLGVLKPLSPVTKEAAARLSDAEYLAKARIHPVNVLVAMRTYASGKGARGNLTWDPVSQITDALDAGFYAAFGAVRPAGKRTVLALDVSGSMGWSQGGMPLTCREAAAALSLVTAATEPQTAVMAFSHTFQPLDISPRMRLDSVVRKTSGLDFGGTDCSLPMLWALENGIEVDTFQVYTDNETWYGQMHPHEALAKYRRQTGIPARLAVVSLTPSEFTIADPADPGSLDVSGFDSAVPGLLADFSRGDI